MLNRAFFSLQSNWIPTAVALANLFLNALLDLAFYHLGTWGLPLSTAVVNVAGSAALLYLLRARIGRLDGRAIVASVSRILLACVLVAGVSYGIWEPLDAVVGRSFPGAGALTRPGTRCVDRGLFLGLQGASGARAPGAALLARPPQPGVTISPSAMRSTRSA